MKLIVTIPAYNEEKTIGEVINSIPRKIKGFDEIRVLVWDDGSTDETISVAKVAGADYVFSNKKNLGLAKTFSRMIKKVVELGADVVVNTDADNQYDQKEMVKLVEPILAGRADMVSGDRRVAKLGHMPWSKKYGNMIGSLTIRFLTGCRINDASSGFRAYTRECLESFNLFSNHTYTHETIIQAINNDLKIVEVPVNFKKRKGDGQSRLIFSVWDHIKKSAGTIFRTLLMYKSFKVFLTMGLIMMALGLMVGIRFLFFFFNGESDGHVQSLVLSSILLNLGFTTMVMGVLADLISMNRKLIIGKGK